MAGSAGAHAGVCVFGWAWVRAQAHAALQNPGDTALCALVFALWCKGSLMRGDEGSLLCLLQLLSPLHPAHLHHGCSKTTICWDLDQSIPHLPAPNLLLSLLDKVSHPTALLRRYCTTWCLAFSLSLMWAGPSCQPKSYTILTYSWLVGRAQSNSIQSLGGTQQAP